GQATDFITNFKLAYLSTDCNHFTRDFKTRDWCYAFWHWIQTLTLQNIWTVNSESLDFHQNFICFGFGDCNRFISQFIDIARFCNNDRLHACLWHIFPCLLNIQDTWLYFNIVKLRNEAKSDLCIIKSLFKKLIGEGYERDH